MLVYGRPHREGTATIGEAERLGIPIVMLVRQEETVLRKHAKASLVIPRAKTDQVALHGPTLICLEAISIALAAASRERTLASLDRLMTIRNTIRPSKT